LEEQHSFNGLVSRRTHISQHQKGKPFWILMKRDDGWQWHQLYNMQLLCTFSPARYHASTSSLNFYRTDALPDVKSTVSKHWRMCSEDNKKTMHDAHEIGLFATLWQITPHKLYIHL